MYFIYNLGLSYNRLDVLLEVLSPLGRAMFVDLVCCHCILNLNTLEFYAYVIVISLSAFDVIFNMYWLSSYHVSHDCFAKSTCSKVNKG